jgi:hypothetical protein
VLVALSVITLRAFSVLSSDLSDRLSYLQRTTRRNNYHYRLRHCILIHQQPLRVA